MAGTGVFYVGNLIILFVHGTAVAVLAVVARRIGALLGIAVILGLVLILMWSVYVHHSAAGVDEPAIVRLDARPA